MTTPTPEPQPQKISAQELRDQFALLHAELIDVRADIAALKAGLQAAATASPTPAGQVQTFTATEIVMTIDERGQPAYKAKGAPYSKYGVRIWPETLPALGIDPAQLKAGPNQCSLNLRVLMVTSTDEAGQVHTAPQKVIGKA